MRHSNSRNNLSDDYLTPLTSLASSNPEHIIFLTPCSQSSCRAATRKPVAKNSSADPPAIAAMPYFAMASGRLSSGMKKKAPVQALHLHASVLAGRPVLYSTPLHLHA